MNFKHFENLNVELKISLEDEGLTFDQAISIACQAHSHNVKVTMKVGGAEAISDMRFAKMIGCSGCVAPMIESLKSGFEQLISVVIKSLAHSFRFVIILSSISIYLQ